MIKPKKHPKTKTLSPQQKLDQSLQIYWCARDLKTVSMAQQHPELNRQQILGKIKNLFKYART